MGAVEGRATPAGTSRFAERAVREKELPGAHFRSGPSGLKLSSIGLGTYLGTPDPPTDLAVEQAVTVCLTSGRVNVVDTAINYRLQRAERSVGRALARLFGAQRLRREEVVVATKIGYLAPDGESELSPQDWVTSELVWPGVLDPEDLVGGSHAMSSSYLADQFRRSRQNLGLESVDVLYLHNAPEAQLAAVGEREFLRRLEAAFALCEEWRTAGLLGSYGLATWDSLRVPPGAEGHFSLEAAVRLAERVGGKDHGFRFVQFPFNRAMPEAAVVPTQPVGGRGLPLFQAAPSLGLACLTSAALLQGRLARGRPASDGLSAAQRALQFARSAPGNLTALVGQKLPTHLSENLELAGRDPWTPEEFRSALA